MRLNLSAVATSLVAGMAASAAFGQAATGWSLNTGLAYTDNATLANSGGPSDTLASVGGAIAYAKETRHIKASLDGQGSYVHYLDDTYDDDFIGNATGNLTLGLIPERFLWTFDDTYGQIATNQFEPITPDNRQNVNNFRTGPDIYLRLGERTDLRLTGWYSDTGYEESGQIDVSTWGGSASFLRKFSSTGSWGFVVSQNRVSYDSATSAIYDQPSVYASFESKTARQSISLDVGANRVEANGRSETNPLVRAAWERRITPSWTMDVDLGSEYQNTSQQFATDADLNTPGAEYIGISNIPAASYRAGLSFSFQRPRTTFSIGTGYSQLDYLTDINLDESAWYATMDFTRKLTPRLQGFVNYRMTHRDYDATVNADVTEQIAAVGLDWGIGRSTFLTFGYRYRDSDSDSSVNSYAENMALLKLSYRRGEISGTDLTLH